VSSDDEYHNAGYGEAMGYIVIKLRLFVCFPFVFFFNFRVIFLLKTLN